MCTAQRLRKAVDDMVTGWANARRSAAQAATNDDTSTDDQPGG
jgi:hypothetical protein